jgi:hypothetical protein
MLERLSLRFRGAGFGLVQAVRFAVCCFCVRGFAVRFAVRGLASALCVPLPLVGRAGLAASV